MARPRIASTQHNNATTPGQLTVSSSPPAYYRTSYGSSYGRENFYPCLGHCQGTEYTGNLRPSFDSHTLGLPLLDSLTSHKDQHYQPFVGANGVGVFVNVCHNKHRETGYLHLTTLPKTESMSLQTEYSRCYTARQPGGNVPQRHVRAGHRGQSGFTKEEDLELNTFQTKTADMGQNRRTGTSMMRTDYMPIRFLQGTEVLRSLPGSASRETGFTRDSKARPADRSAPHLPRSQGGKNTPTKWVIGKKEWSGFVLNNPVNQDIMKRPLDRSHFVTHYWSKFCDPTMITGLRPGPTRDGAHNLRSMARRDLSGQRPQFDGRLDTQSLEKFSKGVF